MNVVLHVSWLIASQNSIQLSLWLTVDMSLTTYSHMLKRGCLHCPFSSIILIAIWLYGVIASFIWLLSASMHLKILTYPPPEFSLHHELTHLKRKNHLNCLFLYCLCTILLVQSVGMSARTADQNGYGDNL